MCACERVRVVGEESAAIKSLATVKRGHLIKRNERMQKNCQHFALVVVFAAMDAIASQGLSLRLLSGTHTQTKYRKIITGVVNYDRFIIIMTQNNSHTQNRI